MLQLLLVQLFVGLLQMAIKISPQFGHKRAQRAGKRLGRRAVDVNLVVGVYILHFTHTPWGGGGNMTERAEGGKKRKVY